MRRPSGRIRTEGPGWSWCSSNLLGSDPPGLGILRTWIRPAKSPPDRGVRSIWGPKNAADDSSLHHMRSTPSERTRSNLHSSLAGTAPQLPCWGENVQESNPWAKDAVPVAHTKNVQPLTKPTLISRRNGEKRRPVAAGSAVAELGEMDHRWPMESIGQAASDEFYL